MSEEKKIPNSLIFILIGIIIGAGLVYGYYNFKIPSGGKEASQIISKGASQTVPNSENLAAEAAAYLKFKEIKASFTPTGVPDVYGKELNISFDQVQDAINKVAPFDPTYGVEGKKIALTDLSKTELERYKKIGASIACEYCCGVKSLTKEDGTAACGCAHSQMMRGLAAYLIKNHSQEFSNEQILNELTKWKITYFPKQTLSAELDKRAKAGEPGIEQILKEFPDFLPQMVGGC